MSNARNKKKRSGMVIAIVVLCVVLAMMVGLLIILEVRSMSGSQKPLQTNGPEHTQATDETEVPETTLPEETSSLTGEATLPEETEVATVPTEPKATEVYHNGQVQTPYLTLYYPEELADHLVVVKHEGDPFILEFYAVLEDKPEQRLFDVYMGSKANGNMGKMQTDSGVVPVGMTLYTFTFDNSWSEGEINTVYAMQDVANDIMLQFPLVEEPAATEAPVISETTPESSIVKYVDYDTPFCTIQFPANWEQYLELETVDEEIYRVLFYGKLEGKEKQLLFSIYFGGDEGDQLGAVLTDAGQYVPVSVEFAELDLSGWAEEDATILYSMQETANQVIEKLPLA